MSWHTDDKNLPRRKEIPASGKYEESLAKYAPFERRCVACGKLCCATRDGVVLWHEETHKIDGTKHDCPGVGMVGMKIPPKERQLEYVG